jgi:hypothetical protein
MQAAHQERQNFEEALKQGLAALLDNQEGEQTKGATVEQDANNVPNRAIRNSCAGPIDSLRGGVSQSSNYIPCCINFIQKLFLSNSSGIAGFPSGMSK